MINIANFCQDFSTPLEHPEMKLYPISRLCGLLNSSRECRWREYSLSNLVTIIGRTMLSEMAPSLDQRLKGQPSEWKVPYQRIP